MLIKGPDTAGWTWDMGDFLDTLDPGDNIPDLWMQFLDKFKQQFQDMQKGDRAHAQLEGLRMHFLEINTYIAKFEELARQVGYTAGNSKTIHMFVKGLMLSVMEDVLKPPHEATYQDIKQKAIKCTRLRVLLDNILKAWNPGGRGFQGGAFWGFQQGNNTHQSFFSWQPPQNNATPCNPQTQYNSLNALQWMNNQPVQMDLSRSRMPSYRGGPHRRVTNLPHVLGMKCYNCRCEEYFTRVCLHRQQSRVNQAEPKDQLRWNNSDLEIGYPTLMATMNWSAMSQLGDQLKALTLDQKKELADEMGVSEDFESTWLDQH
jgi:hypothetical protein